MDGILRILTNLTSEGYLTSGDLNGASVILDNVANNAVQWPKSLTDDQLEVCMNMLQNSHLLLRIQTKLSLKYQ